MRITSRLKTSRASRQIGFVAARSARSASKAATNTERAAGIGQLRSPALPRGRAPGCRIARPAGHRRRRFRSRRDRTVRRRPRSRRPGRKSPPEHCRTSAASSARAGLGRPRMGQRLVEGVPPGRIVKGPDPQRHDDEPILQPAAAGASGGPVDPASQAGAVADRTHSAKAPARPGRHPGGQRSRRSATPPDRCRLRQTPGYAAVVSTASQRPAIMSLEVMRADHDPAPGHDRRHQDVKQQMPRPQTPERGHQRRDRHGMTRWKRPVIGPPANQVKP